MICHETVDFKESCLNPNCLAQKAKAQYKDVKEPMITEFDYIKDQQYPPAIRAAFHNILKILLITGKKFTFNGIFNKQMHKLRQLLKDGIVLNNGATFKVYIYGLIGDEPSRSFACSHKQHNGEHGCIFCLNPGVGNGPSRYWPDIGWPLRT